MKRVTICRAKCLDIVTLKVLPTSCFCYNPEDKIRVFENEAKQNWYEFPCTSSLTKCLEDFEKMIGF